MASNETLVIGDLHLANSLFPGIPYIEYQFDTIRNIVRKILPRDIIFLGDVFHFRKPDPETIVKAIKFFDELVKLCYNPITYGADGGYDKKIYILRGNHDTASKTDTGDFTTILEALTNDYIKIIKETTFEINLKNNFVFIPHYELDETIRTHMKSSLINLANRTGNFTFVFGHFGYQGCLNTAGDADFALTPSDFKTHTFLGHIHKPLDEDNVHVVGTPYGTSFQEVDYQHRVAVINNDTNEFRYVNVDSGLRYLAFDLGSLEANKDFINDPKYNTLLRVYLNQITDQNSVDLRKTIMNNYNVKFVDIKYHPLISEDSVKSDYRPGSMVFDMDDDFINDYIDDCKSEIPKEKLLEGLKLLKKE